MSYSEDIRHLVVTFVRAGGSKAEAARRFQVSRGRVYAWLALPPEDLSGQKPGPKGASKVDMAALAASIAAHPDRQQKEFAKDFGVHESTIHHARKRLKISRKKNVDVHGKKLG